jgi:hypothetical protein
MGSASSWVAFSRTIGGSFGLAIFGTIMTDNFASNFLARVPELVKSVIPMSTLTSMANNPEALMSAGSQNQIRSSLSALGDQGAAAFNQLLLAMRLSLNMALTRVFLIGLIIILLAFVLNFFLREIPLRKKHTPQAAAEKLKQA